MASAGCDDNRSVSHNLNSQDTTDQTTQNNANANPEWVNALAGCYAITPQGMERIKIEQYTISNKVQWGMQMGGVGMPWDDPEPLEIISAKQAEPYFKKFVEANELQGVLARPDRLLVLAKVSPSLKEINPQLDSEFLVYIYKDSNTIYSVSCE